MLFGVVNHSTLIKPSDLQSMMVAAGLQMTRHVAPAWRRQAGQISAFRNEKLVPSTAYLVALFDDADVPSALGYHDLSPSGLIYSRVFVKPVLQNGGTVLGTAKNSLSVISTFTHEINEAFIDPYASFWAHGPESGSGSDWALEVCDAVEELAYPIRIANGSDAYVTNFQLPAWFSPVPGSGGENVYDYMHVLKAPFTLAPGGYSLVKNGDSEVNQIFAEERPADWKLKTKLHVASRTARRRSRI